MKTHGASLYIISIAFRYSSALSVALILVDAPINKASTTGFE
ncbi:MAG: hypothetical protein RQ885_02470 [Desulfurococcales archaeon]|nr:hypothetical protein [Desulfurococcales archaeon]